MRRSIPISSCTVVAVLWASGWAVTGPIGIAVTHAAASESHICGPLKHNTEWTPAGSPYLIDCDLRIPVRSVLVIHPGVSVRIRAGMKVEVRGRLTAIGTPSLPITFRCALGCHRWSGIRFAPDADAGSTMTYATITHAATALSNPPFPIQRMTFIQDGNGIRFDQGGSSAGLIESSTFSHVSHRAIDLGPLSSSSFAITGVTVVDSGTGLVVHDMSPTVTSSTFTRNRIGLQIVGAGSGATNVLNNSIIANRIGLDVVAQAGMLISGNDINGNSRFSLKVRGNTDVTLNAPNNYWGVGIAGPGIAATMDACGFDPMVPAPCVNFKPYLTSPNTAAPAVTAPLRR